MTDEVYQLEWAQLCADPAFADLPYKLELDQWGQVIMSPAGVRHVLLQNVIADHLRALRSTGKTLLELPVQTAENVKVPDVAWLTPERYEKIKHTAVSPIAPEICVEVQSPSNSHAGMMHKKDLYMAAGACEFWLCDENGALRFYDATGKIEHSRLVPAFPSIVEID